MKGSRVYLRIEEEVKEKWIAKAKKRGVTLSDYVRTLVDPEDMGEEKKVVGRAKYEVSPHGGVKSKKADELPSVEFKTYFK